MGKKEQEKSGVRWLGKSQWNPTLYPDIEFHALDIRNKHKQL